MSAIYSKSDFFLINKMEQNGNTNVVNSITINDVCKMIDISRCTASKKVQKLLDAEILDYGLSESKNTRTFYLTEKGIEEVYSLRHLLTRE